MLLELRDILSGDYMDVVIYGAQGTALSAYEAIKDLYPERNIRCFLVSERGINSDRLAGLPVEVISDFAARITDEEKQGLEVIIATPENVHSEIENTLEQYGFINHIRLDADRYSELMKMFNLRKAAFLPLAALPIGHNKPSVHIYMAKHEKDKKLTGQYDLFENIVPIQVGAAMAGNRVADLADNTGDNISEKNGNYCELTALYWLWRNDLSDCDPIGYYGLCQYRRLLDLSDDDLLRLQDNDVDAVLPYPMPYEPSIHAHHERYLQQADYEAMKRAVDLVAPDYSMDFERILNQRYMFNYNVILAKAPVLSDYCSWLFQILEKVEEISEPKGSMRSDRYIGYMGEILETVYFMRNYDRLNIKHANCRMLV